MIGVRLLSCIRIYFILDYMCRLSKGIHRILGRHHHVIIVLELLIFIATCGIVVLVKCVSHPHADATIHIHHLMIRSA